MTGGLDDTQLRNLEVRLTYLRELEDRRAAVLASIGEQGKLSDELRNDILAADTKSRLEDLYLPYKPKRRTRAQIAREAGWSRWPMACWPTRRRTRRALRPASSMPTKAWPTPRLRWKVRARS